MTTPYYTLDSYAAELSRALSTVDLKELDLATRKIYATKGNIYVCGNGGSAAIAEHLTCDCMKGVAMETDLGQWLNITSLASNFPLISAIANDIGYDEIFSKQIEWQVKDGIADVLIAISSSGNSPNILNAITKAEEKGMETIAIVGFDGGLAKQFANIVIHIDSDNYGIIEDASQAIMHFMAQLMRRWASNKDPMDIKY
jgi:D-sedoheptulose 7-phosphate isomerase